MVKEYLKYQSLIRAVFYESGEDLTHIHKMDEIEQKIQSILSLLNSCS